MAANQWKGLTARCLSSKVYPSLLSLAQPLHTLVLVPQAWSKAALGVKKRTCCSAKLSVHVILYSAFSNFSLCSKRHNKVIVGAVISFPLLAYHRSLYCSAVFGPAWR